MTAPANALSSLVVEGYKKMILVSLILSGKVLALPKYTSNVVSRQLKKHSSEYELLGTCCQVGLVAERMGYYSLTDVAERVQTLR